MNRPGISRSMIGERGIVKKRLDPSGYIQIGGELWRAENVEAGSPIEIGHVVQVIKMEGLKLFVSFEDSGK
jgi:membrane-bound ClpP family serine protease